MKTSQVTSLWFQLSYLWVAFKKTALKSAVWLKFIWDLVFHEADAQDVGKEWVSNGCASLKCQLFSPNNLSAQILGKTWADRNFCHFTMISDEWSPSATGTQRKTQRSVLPLSTHRKWAPEPGESRPQVGPYCSLPIQLEFQMHLK